MIRTGHFYFLFSLLLCCLLSDSCINSKTGEDSDASDVYATALIKLEDGRTFDFKATIQTGGAVTNKNWSVGLSDMNTLMLYLFLASDRPIKKGIYSGYITFQQLDKKNIISEKYNSHYYNGKQSGEPGMVKYTVREVDDRHISGSFKVVMYSESGNKAIIDNGVFNIPLE